MHHDTPFEDEYDDAIFPIFQFGKQAKLTKNLLHTTDA